MFVCVCVRLFVPVFFWMNVSDCVAINIINQQNSTQLSAEGRDEEARGRVNMSARVVSPNDAYHTSHAGGEGRRRGGEGGETTEG